MHSSIFKFQRLFLDVGTKRPVLSMPDISCSTMKSLLSFIYTGEVSVDEAQLPQLLQAAETLEIRGLTGPSPNSSHNGSPAKDSEMSLEEQAKEIRNQVSLVAYKTHMWIWVESSCVVA